MEIRPPKGKREDHKDTGENQERKTEDEAGEVKQKAIRTMDAREPNYIIR